MLSTVYLGGGTPTLLDAGLLSRLLEGIRARIGEDAEVTVEANPSTLDGRSAGILYEAGINRVSLGVQSFDGRLRQNLGRAGSAVQARTAVSFLRDAGFENISLDLMFGIPGQNRQVLRSDLEAALALEPEHISYYELSIKEDSGYGKPWSAELARVQEDCPLFYELVVDKLEGEGYLWYETSNLALPGRECRHNLACWDGRDYIGLGAGAWSTVGLRRWRNVEDVVLYLDAESREQSRKIESLSEGQKQAEKLLLGLRRAAGVSREAVKPVINEEQEQLLLKNGFLASEGGRIFLTRPGRLMANEVCARLLQE